MKKAKKKQMENRPARNRRMTKWIWLAAALVLCAAVLLAVGLAVKNSRPAAEVGGIPIAEEELRLYCDASRAQVLSYFSTHYGADGNEPDFWESEFGGESPKEMLLALSLDQIAYAKALGLEAERLGVKTPMTYEAFQKALAEENRQRAEKLKNGIAVYGPQQYGAWEYHSYLQSNLEIDLKDLLLEEALKPTQAQLEEAFAQLDPFLLDKGAALTAGYCYLPKSAATAETAAAALGRAGALLLERKSAEETAEIVKQEFGVAVACTLQELTPDMISREDDPNRGIYDEARALPTGTAGAIREEGDRWSLTCLPEKTELGTISFEEGQSMAVQRWIDGAFKRYMEAKQAALEISRGEPLRHWKVS